MSKIPRISTEDVKTAVKQIEREGVPARRYSTKFHLVIDGKRYPPKYVVSLAAAIATGRELPSNQFSGGPETNSVLKALGFTVEGPCNGSNAVQVRHRKGGDSLLSAMGIARIVVQGKPPSTLGMASGLLLDAFENHWPDNVSSALFTITPGGFVGTAFPAIWRGGIGWKSHHADLDHLARIAEPTVSTILSRTVLRAARRRTKYLTIGIDLKGDTERAELVAIVDVKSGDVIRWTGKSYPTGDQEEVLVQVSDLSSHTIELGGVRVLVLGCHDLNMFSARAYANQNASSPRRKRSDKMRTIARRFDPAFVLHHPHVTETPLSWRVAWSGLRHILPNVSCWASAIRYRAKSLRCPLDEVLSGTCSGSEIVDIIVRSR